MTRHIGIVGCSAEGAALCYRTICEEGAHALGSYEHPEVSLHTPSLARYVDCLNGGDLAGVAELMLASAHKLAAAGADFLICPDNTIHQAFALVAPRSPLPWLHIADVVAAEAAARASKRVESSVGSGELASLMISGISVQPRMTASQPCSCKPAMMAWKRATLCCLITPGTSSSMMMRLISLRSSRPGRTHAMPRAASMSG